MLGVVIALGGGLAAVVTVVITLAIVLKRSQAQTDRADARASSLATRLDESFATNAQLERNVAVFKTNESELKRELASKDARVRELGARLEAVEKARVNFASVLKSNPGLVTSVVGAAFDQLREAVSHAQAAASAAPGDQGGGEAGGVHDAPKGGSA